MLQMLTEMLTKKEKKNQELAIFDTFRKPATERILPPLSVVKKGLSVEDMKN